MCYILTLLMSAKALSIEPDSPKTPLEYHFDREIEFETSYCEFSYEFDISVLTELKNEYINIREICQLSPNFEPLFQTLFYDTIWNLEVADNFPTQNIILSELKVINLIKYDFYTFKVDTNPKKCKHLYSIDEKLKKLNTELNTLVSSPFSIIPKLIPISQLQSNAYNFTSKNNFSTPLDFSHWFVENFQKYAKINVKLNAEKVFLTITIPLFSHSNLLKVYPKPILYNNVPYIANTRTEFVVDEPSGQNYFVDIHKNCFYATNKTFCYKPNYKNDCDDRYISNSSNTFDRKCFIRLPLQNIITQIKNDIYFLIVDPLQLNINCNESKQTISIFQSSKILNNNCTIKSSFYNFVNLDYGIYFPNIPKTGPTKSDSIIFIQLYCFVIFLIIYIVILNFTVCYYYRISLISNNGDIRLETQL